MAKPFRKIKRKPPTLKAALKAGKLKASGYKALSIGVATGAKRGRAATVFIAVIVRAGFKDFPYTSKYDSNRTDDGWYALMGEDKQKLVTQALAKARSFGSDYEVAVGVLDEMVVIPTFFEYHTL